MKVSLIVAVAENGVIGKDNDLIWHLPKDMHFFKETTMGHHVIMGRKNFESIPERFRPLPNRTNVVITKQSDYQAEGCVVVNSLKAALEVSQHNGDNEPFVIGGGQIYKLALEENLVDKIYLTKVHQAFDGDTFFPELSEEWKEVERVNHQADEKHACGFSIITYEK